MVYNLPGKESWPTFNHECLFNLFGCYGDVLRVRLMNKPENSGMVEMANPRMVRSYEHNYTHTVTHTNGHATGRGDVALNSWTEAQFCVREPSCTVHCTFPHTSHLVHCQIV